MPIYRFTVTRDVTESVSVTVEAHWFSEAEAKAIKDVERYAEKDNLGNVDWTLDDCPSGSDVYVADPEDFEIVGN